jgi:hypothetical protein
MSGHFSRERNHPLGKKEMKEKVDAPSSILDRTRIYIYIYNIIYC